MNDECKAIALVIATFPAEFGLCAFPGDRFRIGERESYFGGPGNGTLMLYTQRWNGREWCDFAKGTEAELRRQIVRV